MSKQSKRERQRLNREARRQYEETLAKRRRRMKTARNFAIFATPVLIVGIIVSLSSSSESSAGACTSVSKPPPRTEKLTAPPMGIDPNASYTAEITTNCGTIEIALDAKDYPIAVNNFVALANQGFYDNLAVVRSAKGFVFQTGSPDQTANGDPGYSVHAEAPKTPYTLGTVAMAKNGTDPAGTVGSQFFVVTGAGAAKLTPDFAIVGHITKGLSVAQRIASFAPASGDGPPTKTVVMKKVRIVTQPTTPSSTASSTTSTT